MTNQTVQIVDPPIKSDALKRIIEVMKKIGSSIDESNVFILYKNSLKSLIFEQGITKIIQQSLLEEKLIIKGTPRDQIVKEFHEFTNHFLPIKKITIIDQFIFPDKHDPDYLQLFVEILVPYIDSLWEICFITQRYNERLFSDFKEQIKELNESCTISLKENGDFHDRFWIFDDTYVLIVGTSLNGLGKKYCLMDKVNEIDSKELISEIKKISYTNATKHCEICDKI